MFTIKIYLRSKRSACLSTVEPDYNGAGLGDTSSITSDVLWYQLIPYC
jgi:hypothetical protein